MTNFQLKNVVGHVVKFTLLKLKQILGYFPGGAVVKNPPPNAGDTGSSPRPGRSYMEQPSPCATTTEPEPEL